MAYQKTRHYSNGAELLITNGTLVRAIQVPQGALAKLSEPSPYNPALDSDVVEAPTVQVETVAQNIVTDENKNEFQAEPEIDVVALLSKEEPAVQATPVSAVSDGEPAYGAEPKPVNNVIQFPNMSQEPAMVESPNQYLDELGDALARLEEAQNVTATLLEQAKEAYQRVQGKEAEYKKVA